MGCISSKEVLPASSTHLNNRHFLASQPTAISALNRDHNLIDALESIPDSNHNDNIDDRSRFCYSKSCQSLPDDNKSTIERCASFHTVEEYDALIQRVSNNKKEIIIATDDDNDDKRGIRRKKIGEALAGSLNLEFQTVGSLRQWLDDHVTSTAAAGGGGDAGADFPTPKFGSYSINSNNGPAAPGMNSNFVEINSKEEEENVPEVDPDLVAAFEEYMQQLESEEDDILKLIEPDRAR